MVSLAGGLQAKSMTSYRAEPSKMAGMRYHGNVMTTTRWRLYVILHLQQYSHRLNLFFVRQSVHFHSCNNNTTLEMAATEAAGHVAENIMNKIHHKRRSAFRWLFIYYGRDLRTEDGTY